MTSARTLGPNGEPGSSPAGASPLKRRAQQGQTPACRLTRVISGAIGGISIRSYTSQGACGLFETSAPQCPQTWARMSCRCVGLGCNGRCAPGCGFFLRRLLTNSVVLFCRFILTVNQS